METCAHWKKPKVGAGNLIRYGAIARCQSVSILMPLSVENFPSHRFDLTVSVFLFKPFLLRAAGRFCRPPYGWPYRDACDHFLQALHRFFLVLFQAAVRLGLDDHHAFFRDALITECE